VGTAVTEGVFLLPVNLAVNIVDPEIRLAGPVSALPLTRPFSS
jgi:hypothetical protein